MIRPQFVYFNGAIVPYEDAKIGVLTHGLHYGTGCFEGLRAYWNADREELFMLQATPHFERLHQSARILYLTLERSVEELCAIATELLQRNAFKEDVYIRPLLYTSDEIIGARLHNVSSAFAMIAVPMGGTLKTDGIKVCVSSWRRLDDTAMPARAKITGSYVNSSLAKTEAFHNGFDDALFLNQDGHVSEASGMNLFLVRKGQIVTPGVQQNILEGITRHAVIQIVRDELGMEVVERSVDRTELYVADELFLCGTGAQIAPIVQVDHRPVGGTGTVGPVAQRVMEVYARAVRGEDARYADWVTPVYVKSKA